jgi:SAM-dependent methyltransferase
MATDRAGTRARGRIAFDRIADVYDRARPGYPEELFDVLALPGSRVLEIGCGTGQASVSLASRGCELTAVELGPRLASLAVERLRPYPSAQVVVADFDCWTPSVGEFDLVFSATAFHWLDPATRADRVADLLRPGGQLATVATHHVAGGTRRFFEDVQACYRRFDPRTADAVLRPASRVPFDGGLGRRFHAAEFHRYEWTATYSTAEYLDLLRTYSTTLTMPAMTAEALLRSIGSLIDGRYDGRITKQYLTELRTARRR